MAASCVSFNVSSYKDSCETQDFCLYMLDSPHKAEKSSACFLFAEQNGKAKVRKTLKDKETQICRFRLAGLTAAHAAFQSVARSEFESV